MKWIISDGGAKLGSGYRVQLHLTKNIQTVLRNWAIRGWLQLTKHVQTVLRNWRCLIQITQLRDPHDAGGGFGNRRNKVRNEERGSNSQQSGTANS